MKRDKFYTPFKPGKDHILYGKPGWNKGKKMPHSEEWEEKRLRAVREAAKNRIYPKGYHRPESAVKPMLKALKKWQNENPEKKKEFSIKNLPKNVSGNKNGNWRGGITKLNYNWRTANIVKLRKWRNNILAKFNNKCVNCGSIKNLEAHHIVSLIENKELAFEVWNGVCLCRECHKKTDSWGGQKKEKINISKSIVRVITIPHKWQEYETCGNWKILKNGEIIIFISKLNDPKSEILVAIHELVETVLCKYRDIKEKKITNFDIEFENNRLEGNNDEPGDDPSAPYRKEHFFATNIERLMSEQLGVNWNKYEEDINNL